MSGCVRPRCAEPAAQVLLPRRGVLEDLAAQRRERRRSLERNKRWCNKRWCKSKKYGNMQIWLNLREISRICTKFAQKLRKFAKCFLQTLRKFARNLRPRVLRYRLFLSDLGLGRAPSLPAAGCAGYAAGGAGGAGTRAAAPAATRCARACRQAAATL